MSLFSRRARRSEQSEAEIKKLAEKREALAEATEQWLNLLRDMERSGESSDPRYETYYQAYVQAKHQEKRTELQLFNLRQGLSS